MTEHMHDHIARKQALLDGYDLLLAAAKDLQMDVAALHEAKSNLELERFVVAVCGQMNSGKSTLLNALLFGDEILPMRATTMTAKVAVLEGGHPDKVEATLYTEREWADVLRAAAQDPTAEEELAGARARAASAGHRESDLVRNPARMMAASGLGSLAQFVAVPDRGGVLTPYVSQVRVIADRPWLHEVTVADTPGTNDPNPQRDLITKQWISRADAVVYVTYAGQVGMDLQDVQFIQAYLAHIDPARRIIAVNKCDGMPDSEAIERHFDRLRHGDDLTLRELFRDPEQVVQVSSLGALLEAMRDARRPMSAAHQESLPVLEALGWLSEARHKVGALRSLVEKRIISTKGVAIIASHRDRLSSAVDQARRQLESEQGELLQQQRAMDATQTERDQEKDKISESISSLSDIVLQSRAVEARRLDRLELDLRGKLKTSADRMATEIENVLREEKQIDNLAGAAKLAVARSIFSQRGALDSAIDELTAQMERGLEEAEAKLAAEALKSGLKGAPSVFHAVDVSPGELTRSIQKSLQEALESRVARLIEEATNVWQRVFNTKGGRSNVVGALKNEIVPKLLSELESLIQEVRRDVQLQVGQGFSKMELNLRKRLDSRQAVLRSLEDAAQADGERRGNLRGELARVDALKKLVDDLEARLNATLGTSHG
jgi:hypothetical protein